MDTLNKQIDYLELFFRERASGLSQAGILDRIAIESGKRLSIQNSDVIAAFGAIGYVESKELPPARKLAEACGDWWQVSCCTMDTNTLQKYLQQLLGEPGQEEFIRRNHIDTRPISVNFTDEVQKSIDKSKKFAGLMELDSQSKKKEEGVAPYG